MYTKQLFNTEKLSVILYKEKKIRKSNTIINITNKIPKNKNNIENIPKIKKFRNVLTDQ